MNHNESRSPILYMMMVLLAAFFSFIGFNFGGVLGACIGFAISCIGNVYALKIKAHE